MKNVNIIVENKFIAKANDIRNRDVRKILVKMLVREGLAGKKKEDT